MWNENNPDNNSNSNQNIGTYHNTYSPNFTIDDNEINSFNNSNIRHFKKYHDGVTEDNNIDINYNNYNDCEDKNKKKWKLILFILLVLIIIILAIFLVIKIFLKPSTKKEPIKASLDNSIKNIYIEGEDISPSFNGEIYDYYVLTDKEELSIKCDLGKDSSNVVGCNETIKLNNLAYYIHQIYSENGTLYRINIKTKDNKDENLISIDSISGLDKKTNNSVTIKVNASSKSGGLSYSIDNGLTYQTSNTFVINENKKIYLIVRDKYGNLTPVREIDVNNIDEEIPTANIEIIKSSTDSVTIAVFGKDDSNNLLYSFNDQEFTTKNTLELEASGQIRVKVKDDAGNISGELSIFVRKSDFINKTKYIATFHKNGSIISNSYAICTNQNNGCTITLPNIEREGYEILGWSKDKNSHNPEYKAGERITLTDSIDLYAITKKEVSVIFDYNGILPNKHQKNCTLYGEDKCNVEVPSFTFDKGKIIGWNLYNDSESVLVSSGNKYSVSENTVLYALAYSTIQMSFDKNGADSISSTSMNCRVINNNEGCHVTLPIIKKDGAEVLGWSTDPNAKEAEYRNDSKSLINESIKLYAITRSVVNIDFDKNGADSITNTRVTCTYYNKDKSCNIKTPIIRRNGASIIGWDKDSNSHNATLGQDETITVKKSAKYYAITSVPISIYFDRNGATAIGFTNQSCTYYNASQGCSIDTPSITRNGWKIVGWNKSKNGTSAELRANSTGTVSKSATYYAVTSKSATATFNTYSADSLYGCSETTADGCQATCNYYNSASSCKVKVPYIMSKGNEVQLFSTSTNISTLSGYTPGTDLSISADITLYAIVKNYYRHYTFSIVKTQTFGHVPFETEAGCSSAVYNNYYSFVNRLYNSVPYIFGAGKVTFAGKSAFQSTWGSDSAGMTYGKVIGYRNVDVICPTNFDRYYLKTIVHELTHAWDSYYKLKYGEYLSSMSDVVALYNKYSKMSSSNRPLRDYSYSNKFEFIADMYSWYYFLYIDSTYAPSQVTANKYYPSDMKKVMEKYIKIAKNGYK